VPQHLLCHHGAVLPRDRGGVLAAREGRGHGNSAAGAARIQSRWREMLPCRRKSNPTELASRLVDGPLLPSTCAVPSVERTTKRQGRLQRGGTAYSSACPALSCAKTLSRTSANVSGLTAGSRTNDQVVSLARLEGGGRKSPVLTTKSFSCQS
jgi:hypothetical protein